MVSWSMPRANAAGPTGHCCYDAAGRPAGVAGRSRVPRLRPRRAARVHRLAAVLQRLGDEGQVPRHPEQPRHRGGGPQALRRRPGHARSGSSRRSGCSANGIIGIFPANAVGDDTIVYADSTRTEVPRPAAHLRQQGQHREGIPNRSLATSSPRPRPASVTTSAPSLSPLVSVRPSAMHGVQGRARRLLAILLESLGRPAGRGLRRAACTSGSHGVLGVCRPKRTLDNEDLIAERYRGIRPAPGYPACPEHTEKQTLWDLLDVDGHRDRTHRVDGDVARSRSLGLYFAHPDAAYFVVGRLGSRSGRGVCRAQGLDPARGRALARGEPRLPPGRLIRAGDDGRIKFVR
jgi:hypothetical protein